jgi:hypothetical protein
MEKTQPGSPMAKWIAYSRAGDIWKLRVGPLGTHHGDPILVADMEAGIGLPTWSDDGRTIVFDAGMIDETGYLVGPGDGRRTTWLNGVAEWRLRSGFWRNLIDYAGYTP